MATIQAVSRRKLLLLLSSVAIALMAAHPLRAQEKESKPTLCEAKIKKISRSLVGL